MDFKALAHIPRSPIGVLGLFLILVYVLSGALLTGNELSANIQTLLIGGVIFITLGAFAVFVWVLVADPQKFYGPYDYQGLEPDIARLLIEQGHENRGERDLLSRSRSSIKPRTNLDSRTVFAVSNEIDIGTVNRKTAARAAASDFLRRRYNAPIVSEVQFGKTASTAIRFDALIQGQQQVLFSEFLVFNSLADLLKLGSEKLRNFERAIERAKSIATEEGVTKEIEGIAVIVFSDENDADPAKIRRQVKKMVDDFLARKHSTSTIRFGFINLN